MRLPGSMPVQAAHSCPKPRYTLSTQLLLPRLLAAGGSAAQLPRRSAPVEALEGAAAIARHFSQKWRHDDVSALAAAHAWASRTGSEPISVDAAAEADAARRLNRPNVLDRAGVCPAIAVCAGELEPEVVSECLTNTLASAHACQAECVVAKAFGKKSRTPSPDAARLIMPLTTLWGICDVMISRALHAWMDTHVPLPPGCMEAGVTGTGAAHAVLGARLVLE